MIYICKCGKNFSKSSNAATTGFRDTDTCRGCPHLLPYGENYFDDVQRAFVLDIKGYECRASQFLRYQTELSGALDDKTTIRIESLDFDFLERVSNWVKEHYPDGELSGSFSREDIRSAEYTSDGRYCYSLSCSQNKKGIAAKRVLWAEFFDEAYRRTDMSAEEETEKVLKDIQLGIERAKEAVLMHYKDKNTGWVYRVSPQPAERELYFIEYLDPSNSVIFNRLPGYPGSKFKESAEEVLAARARRNGWTEIEEEDNTCPRQSAPTGDAAVTTTENAVKLLAGAEETPTISESAVDASTLTGLNEKEIPEMAAATAADAEPAASPAPLASDSMTEATAAGDCVATENVEGVTAVSLPDGNDIDIPAGFDYSGMDEQKALKLQNLARRAVLVKRRYALDMMEIVAEAHQELVAQSDNEVVHLVDNSKHGNRGEESFRRWCASIGIGKTTAYKLLQVKVLMDNSTEEEQEVLSESPANLLYITANPNAPDELVQAVKDREITTLKQFKEMEAQLKETQERAKRAEREAQEAKEKAHRLETRPVLSELYNANQRIKELENRPIEVATQAPTEEQINAAAEPVIQEMTAMYKVQQEQQREQIRELKAIVAASRNAIPNACRAIAESCAAAFASGFEEFQAMAQDLSDDEYMNAVEPIFEACREILDSLEGADYVEG